MFDRIKNLFRKAGAELGMVNSLTKIIDHPKINVEQSEYDRIAKSLQYLKAVLMMLNTTTVSMS
ncbi:hypothetical protein [Latilactobacillus sakei]|uniref:hypothetical protein n=1 Tax=Latilactobacillus sakei TaxID=1599 RepID=UPI0012EDE795|nr:hypothetical protein [Latilactobacillus sakei]